MKQQMLVIRGRVLIEKKNLSLAQTGVAKSRKGFLLEFHLPPLPRASSFPFFPKQLRAFHKIS